MDGYSIHVSSTDTYLAYEREGRAAESDGLKNLAKRMLATALHIKNAEHHMSKLCPEGYRVNTRIVFELVPNVNAVLKDEFRR